MPMTDTDYLTTVLRTGLTPSASGSAYLELEQPTPSSDTSITAPISTLKLSCTVHGPKPLPRSAPYSPQLVLATHVKFTPFASRNVRRGFVRDASERDLGVHLEAALRGVIIGDRWPKSGVDVTITVLEAEEDGRSTDQAGSGQATNGRGIGGASMMNVLAGCITVASAAIIEAGIDCVDTVTGGIAAIVRSPGATQGVEEGSGKTQVVMDPCPSEHERIVAACVVGYLHSRDEVTELWLKGDVGSEVESLLDAAMESAKASQSVVAAVLKESIEARISASAPKNAGELDGNDQQRKKTKGKGKAPADDSEMTR